MLELILRFGLSLLIVFGMIWVMARLVRGRGLRRGHMVTLLSRTQLTRGSAVAVVLVADRALVLGATDHGVTLLAETAPDAVADLTNAGRPRPRHLLGVAQRATAELGTIAPDTAIPGATVPGSVVPGATVPGAVVPGSVVSDTIVPGMVVPGTAGRSGGWLAGSALSVRTWRQAIEAIRDRTVRR